MSQATASTWHAIGVEPVLAALGTHPTRGLTSSEARRRLERVGENRIGRVPDTSLLRLALRQFRSLVVLLLLAASVVAALLGEIPEALAILVALLLNAGIGFATEWRARTSLARLRDLVTPQALVRRDGQARRIPAADVVPGDLLLLETGVHVAADGRVVESAGLRVIEATLTGESAPVDKETAPLVPPDAPLAERRTVVHAGTAVVAGHGVAVVTATGDTTELGRIAVLVASVGERTTPLERQVEALGRRLVVLALAICAVVALAGILRGQPIGLMIETAITLAVSAVPEGLPAIVTIALAAGVWRLAHAGALVRRLPAVETLGATTVICADKTGTMTENRMTVRRLAFDRRTIVVDTGPTSPAGAFRERDHAIDPDTDPDVRRLLTVAALANDANVETGPEGIRLHGDPTETALLLAAMRAGLDPVDLARRYPRRREVPFSAETRFMATFHEMPAGPHWLVKGAPGSVVARCRFVEIGEDRMSLDDQGRDGLLARDRALATEGYRVLAVAWQQGGTEDLDRLAFLGFVAMDDPVRAGVREAIASCRAAGVRTIMLTGDQRLTAEAVGRQLGLAPDAIRSRVSPEDKLALVAALQRDGEVVAMTGDGVNDAPALARADIGVAMGRRGTDVAREAADLVLTDDNFATIVRAIEEGRAIYENLRKVVRFLFSCNLSEILTVFVAVLAGLPAPLLPLQILWVNIVTDILPALALIRDPAGDVLARRPRDPREALVSWPFGARMLAESVVLAAGVLSAHLWVFAADGPGPRATTVAFVALVLVHPLQAINCRSERESWWRLPPNRLAWLSLAVLVAVQWWAISWDPLARLLGTIQLSAGDWLLVALAVTWPVLALEGVKWRRRRAGSCA